MSRGGYQPESRLDTIRDEILLEVLTGVLDPCGDVQRRAFAEIARLGRKYRELLDHVARALPHGASPLGLGA